MLKRILIADEFELGREGLKIILELEPGNKVIGMVSDGREAVEASRRLCPDLVIIDAALPLLNGIEATRQIIKLDPSIKVIGLSRNSDGRLAKRMLQAGASGYLPKNCGIKELKLAVQNVFRGEMYLGPVVTKEIVQESVRESVDNGPHKVLTSREREVLQLLAEGRTNREIARMLFVSEKTIESHRKNLMDKLGIHSIAELTKYAIRYGVTTLDE